MGELNNEKAAYHTKSHTFVAIYKIAEVLTGGRHRDTFAVTEFMQSTVDAEVCLPVLAIG